MIDVKYGAGFQHDISAGSYASARRIVPILLDRFAPGSVLDVGCGAGNWLAAWAAEGITDIRGLDGSYVPKESLRIPADRFTPHDLAQSFDLGRRFDLVSSLEVAEHLPPERATGFVADLCRHGDVVMFGAAIPGQEGVHHVNCQWQSWWAELFARQGYAALDIVRPRVWNDDTVEWWYRQNTIVYVKGGVDDHWGLDLVHPLFLSAPQAPTTLGQHLRDLPAAVVRSARHRLHPPR